MLKLINTLSRYIVGLVFLFSGFVKLVDPYGTAYKISDYLQSVNLILPLWLALAASVTLSLTEFTLGLNSLFKVRYEGTTKLLLSIVTLFTILTLYIAIANPVQDCGCFGDALVISNWATFAKNIVLLLLSYILWRNRSYDKNRLKHRHQAAMSFVFIVFALLMALTAIRHLPFIDFRPYSVGTSIPEQMSVPEGMPQDVYETTFIYEKDGVQKRFTEDNYPWQDSTWHYVDSESVLVKKGYEAPIHDFVIEHPEWGDITEEVLQDPSYTFLLISPKLEKASLKHQEDIAHLQAYCEERGYRFLLLTATSGPEAEAFDAHFSSSIERCTMDEITLKTIIRSNPGLVILKEGIILEKYAHNDLPQISPEEAPLSVILRQQERQKNRIIILLLTLLLGGLIYKLSQKKDFTQK